MNAQTQQPEQLSQAWFDARIGAITGSRVGAALGLSPFQSPDDLLRQMVREYHGAEPEFTGNKFTEWGQAHEPDAIAALEIEHGVMVDPAPLVEHPEIPWLKASPDGYTSDGGLCETKCPQRAKSLEEVPHYVAQMQLQMACTERPFCYFVQWLPDGVSTTVRVERDPDWLDTHLPTLEAFYERYMETIASEELSAPHLEPLVVEREDETWISTAQQLREISAQIKTLQAQEKKLKSALVDLAAGKKSAGAGVSVYPTSRKSVDYKALIADTGVDTHQYEKESVSWTVRVNS